jgi:hypothetical protein
VSKQIQYAGYSILKDGTWKFRTATDEKRIFQLEAFGESVYMVSIKPVTTKGAAAKELLAMDYMGKNPECVAFFVKHARDENPFAKPKKKSGMVRVKRTKSDPVEAYFLAVEADQPVSRKEAARLRAEFNERVRIAYEAN